MTKPMLLIMADLRPSSFDFRNAGSRHFEVGGHPDLEVAADILAVDPDGQALSTVRGTRFASRAHAYIRGAPAGSVAVARVSMRASPAGFLRTAHWMAILAALMLTAAWFALPEIASEGKDVAPLILIVPSILTAYLFRPGEHALATEMLAGLRVLLLTIGLLSFVSAAALAAGMGPDLLRWVIGASAVVAWIASTMLVRSSFEPGARVDHRRG